MRNVFLFILCTLKISNYCYKLHSALYHWTCQHAAFVLPHLPCWHCWCPPGWGKPHAGVCCSLLETKRGSNIICKHMYTLSLKTVRCEVVFTHLVCPTPHVVADMKRQVGILQVSQPLCTQFPTFFRLCRIRELKKAFVAPIFAVTLSLLIETAESFALRHSYLSTYASRHHMCSRRSLAPAATVLTTSHGTPSLVSFTKE